MLSNNERRKTQRLNGATIQAQVKRKSLFSLGGFQQTKVADFNRFGTRILHGQKFRIGEELLLNINKQGISISNIIGFVCHIEELEKDYSYGVQFDFSANKHMRSAEVEASLSQLEEALAAGASASNMVKPHTGTQAPHPQSS